MRWVGSCWNGCLMEKEGKKALALLGVLVALLALVLLGAYWLGGNVAG